MHKYQQKPELDIIREILQSAIEYRADSVFLKSLYQQYLERGSLSKKQLQGLHDKASKIKEIAPGKLATLQAKIIKMADRFRSEIPETKPLYTKDESAGDLIKAILTKYPQHKRVLFLKSKFDNNEVLTATEITELKKFSKLLM